VFIVHTESSCGWGGQELRILREAQGFLERGDRVHLLAAPMAPIYAAAARHGVPATALAIERKSARGLGSVRQWLATEGRDADIVNTHSSTDSWLAALALRALRHRAALIRTRHVSAPVGRDPATYWLYRRATRHIVTAGEAIREQLHRVNGYPLDAMTSVPTGVDLARFAPRDAVAARAALGLRERPALGIVATLRSWKGHALLLDAFARLAPRHPEWQLLIVGDGPQRANLERRIADEGLADSVFPVGNQEDVPAWLAALDLFVLPSYANEGVPQSVMQAMACGRPVVSTHTGGIGEAVVDGETGILVPPKDVPALATALDRLMSDAELRDRYGAASAARARARFGLELMLDRMRGVFARFAGGEAPAGG
jgi:glycosyltransferase involved in cell wall biosynthesis